MSKWIREKRSKMNDTWDKVEMNISCVRMLKCY